MLTVNCKFCNKEFTTQKSTLKKGEGKFCSKECAYKGRKTRPTTMNICTKCGKETKNKFFCSRSCSASHNNKTFPKRTKQVIYTCTKCSAVLQRKRLSGLCANCKAKESSFGMLTLEQVVDNNPNAHSRHTRITMHSRTTYRKSDKPKQCTICGYSKHYEVCHIKPIASFVKTTLMSEVNSIDNLKALCPNCHWEYDNGLLKL